MEIDFSTGTWVGVRRWAEGELASLRLRNDAPLDATETAQLRGSVQALKKLLALPEVVARDRELSGSA